MKRRDREQLKRDRDRGRRENGLDWEDVLSLHARVLVGLVLVGAVLVALGVGR